LLQQKAAQNALNQVGNPTSNSYAAKREEEGQQPRGRTMTEAGVTME
jgi:hypothetical protein